MSWKSETTYRILVVKQDAGPVARPGRTWDDILKLKTLGVKVWAGFIGPLLGPNAGFKNMVKNPVFR
jgi:hypothetical protein